MTRCDRYVTVWLGEDAPWPPDVEFGKLYIYFQDKAAFAVFGCPCGCGDTIALPFIGAGPCWKLTEHDDGSVTLHPSILRKAGCKCSSHFFIREGRVRWC